MRIIAVNNQGQRQNPNFKARGYTIINGLLQPVTVPPQWGIPQAVVQSPPRVPLKATKRKLQAALKEAQAALSLGS